MKAYPQVGLDVVNDLNKPRDWFYYYIDKGLFLVLIMLVLSLLVFDHLSDLAVDIIALFLLLYFGVYFFYVRLGNLFRNENRTYNVLGKIFFHDNFVELLTKQVHLSEIENIEITAFDFEGKNTSNYLLYKPLNSLGINNYCKIRFKNGTIEKYQFKLNYDTKLYIFRKELIHYYKLGLIRELNLHEILGNHSFKSKQIFRENNEKYPN